ncbi:hypothetical protein LIER_15275 [Lithospermum erythrorhizon]|uniref:Uncharacterized protein n=1 Tax=Lithospermum erythrorhizon TaxID=34254 RepID=A0AAV3Q5F2_LITER
MIELCIQNMFRGNKFAMVLDNLLVLTFEHLKICYKSGRLMQVFKILLQSFQARVLTAYKSKFAQSSNRLKLAQRRDPSRAHRDLWVKLGNNYRLKSPQPRDPSRPHRDPLVSMSPSIPSR